MSWTPEALAEYYAQLRGDAPSAPQEPTETLEAAIQEECTKILEEDGWRSLRTDPVSDRGRGKGFGEVGMPDNLYIRYCDPAIRYVKPQSNVIQRALCQVLWIEYKAGREKAKKHQTAWHIRERVRGALVWVANEDFPATIEGFREHYRQSGLMRRKGE